MAGDARQSHFMTVATGRGLAFHLQAEMISSQAGSQAEG
jgi:hypothetical protein